MTTSGGLIIYLFTVQSSGHIKTQIYTMVQKLSPFFISV